MDKNKTAGGPRPPAMDASSQKLKLVESVEKKWPPRPRTPLRSLESPPCPYSTATSCEVHHSCTRQRVWITSFTSYFILPLPTTTFSTSISLWKTILLVPSFFIPLTAPPFPFFSFTFGKHKQSPYHTIHIYHTSHFCIAIADCPPSWAHHRGPPSQSAPQSAPMYITFFPLQSA